MAGAGVAVSLAVRLLWTGGWEDGQVRRERGRGEHTRQGSREELEPEGTDCLDEVLRGARLLRRRIGIELVRLGYFWSREDVSLVGWAGKQGRRTRE